MPDTGPFFPRLASPSATWRYRAETLLPLGPAGRRLLALLSAVLLLLCAVFAAVTTRDRDDALEDGWQAAERAATGVAEHGARSLAAARLLTDRLAEVVRRDGAAVYRGPGGQAALEAMLRHAPQVNSLWLLDAEGRLAASSLEPEPPSADLSSAPYFAPLREGREAKVTPLARGRLTGLWFSSYALAVRDAGGGFLGLVSAAMHAEEFQRFHAGLGLPMPARSGLFRLEDGAPAMLAPTPEVAPDGETPRLPPWVPSASVLELAAAGVASGRYEAHTSDGTPILVAWARLAPGDPLVAVAALPRDEVLLPFRHRLVRNAGLFGLAVALVIALGWATAAALARSAASRRAAEAGRRELGALLEATREAVVVLDADWGVTFLNSRAVTTLEGGPDLLGQPFATAFPDVAAGPVLRACEETLRRRQPVAAEIAPPRLGRRFAVETHPREEGGLVLFLRDVTEERQVSARIAESEARLRRVLDNLFAFVGVLTPDGVLIEANRAPLEAAGITIEEVRGRFFWDCHWWSHDPAAQARLREACAAAAAGRASRYDVEVRMAGDSRMMIDFQIAPLRDAAGRITHLIPSATDVTARTAAELALAESESRLRLAQEAADVGVFERDLVNGRAHWSGAMFRLWGVDPARGPWIDDATYLALLHPDDREEHRARRDAMRADPGQTRFAFEFRIRRADTGEVRWIGSRGEVVRDAAGDAQTIRGVNYDVTERHRAEERQMLLAREVDHRAKNALAVVQSIVGLTRHAEPEAFRAAVTGRIAAMARAHTLLAREGWDGAELRELVEQELAPHRGADAPERATGQGPAVALAPGAAQPLAMALHELATNAAKYGALSVPGGRVGVTWERPDAGGLALRWTETGGPALAGSPDRRGFGSSVIRSTVERQLGGSVRFDWRPEGLVCDLALPPRQLRATQAHGLRT
jgi:PAS domain S-box-containing protein